MPDGVAVTRRSLKAKTLGPNPSPAAQFFTKISLNYFPKIIYLTWIQI